MRATNELYDLAAREGIKVRFTQLRPVYLGLYIRRPGVSPTIVMDMALTRRERYLRAVFAEELGHHFTTAGAWVRAASSVTDKVMRSKVEQKAIEWAEDYLIDDAELLHCWRLYQDADECADHFWVPRTLVMDKLQRIAQKRLQWSGSRPISRSMA